MFIKYTAFHLQQLSIKKKEDAEIVKNKDLKNSQNKVEKNENLLETEEAKKIIDRINSGSQLDREFYSDLSLPDKFFTCLLQWRRALKMC